MTATTPPSGTVLLAGDTGDLGGRILRNLVTRNLQLRRDFAQTLDATEIQATSILNGAFTDMLSGQAPMILFSRSRVLFWSDPHQVLDFTTKDDAATYTAAAALDERAPRVLQTHAGL